MDEFVTDSLSVSASDIYSNFSQLSARYNNKHLS